MRAANPLPLIIFNDLEIRFDALIIFFVSDFFFSRWLAFFVGQTLTTAKTLLALSVQKWFSFTFSVQQQRKMPANKQWEQCTWNDGFYLLTGSSRTTLKQTNGMAPNMFMLLHVHVYLEFHTQQILCTFTSTVKAVFHPAVYKSIYSSSTNGATVYFGYVLYYSQGGSVFSIRNSCTPTPRYPCKRKNHIRETSLHSSANHTAHTLNHRT